MCNGNGFVVRKARWAAAAAGVVLLVAGCGSEGGSGQGEAGDAPSSGSSAPAKAGPGGGPDAAAVKREIETAATAAGFTEKPADDVPPALKSCMVTWQADEKKVNDSGKSYDSTVAALVKAGWKEGKSLNQQVSVIKTLDKSGWSLKASHHGKAGVLDMVTFLATDTGPACEKLFQEDLAKNK